ncbi:MAG: hypothetical protein HN757_13405 [Calditrichaeota bacterium]|nr:hypothetical protein [Calditrichota bacterium]
MSDIRSTRKLIDIGMTEREAKLYLAMLQRDEADATELHRLSGVVRTKAYETLQIMVQRGYCLERVSGKQRYFRAVPPDSLVDIFKDRWAKETDVKNENADQIFNDLDRVFRLNSKLSHEFDFVEVIRNPEQSAQRFIQSLNESQIEILALCRTPYAGSDPKYREAQIKAHYELYNRGVVTRSLYMYEEEVWPLVQNVIESITEPGQEARIVDDIPTKVFIFDKKTVRLDVPSTHSTDHAMFTTVVVKDVRIAAAFIILFETIWARSLNLEDWLKKIEK